MLKLAVADECGVMCLRGRNRFRLLRSGGYVGHVPLVQSGGWADREVDVLSKSVYGEARGADVCVCRAWSGSRDASLGPRLSGRSRGGGRMCRLSVRLNGWMEV